MAWSIKVLEFAPLVSTVLIVFWVILVILRFQCNILENLVWLNSDGHVFTKLTIRHEGL